MLPRTPINYSTKRQRHYDYSSADWQKSGTNLDGTEMMNNCQMVRGSGQDDVENSVKTLQ